MLTCRAWAWDANCPSRYCRYESPAAQCWAITVNFIGRHVRKEKVVAGTRGFKGDGVVSGVTPRVTCRII